jgi:hypothetical protein
MSPILSGLAMIGINHPIKYDNCSRFPDEHDDTHGNGRMTAGDTHQRRHDRPGNHGKETNQCRSAASIPALGLHGHGKTTRPQGRQRRNRTKQHGYDHRQRCRHEEADE